MLSGEIALKNNHYYYYTARNCYPLSLASECYKTIGHIISKHVLSYLNKHKISPDFKSVTPMNAN